MKLSKRTKSSNLNKILRMISRNEQFERNGGGQFVATTHKYKDKTKYDRKQMKKEMSKLDISFYFL